MRLRVWIRIALLNLLIVASLGTLMRYKIGFKFPYFDQKFIQESHSHFAFSGWITHVLYVLIVLFFLQNAISIREKTYKFLILANLASAYGMLVSFFVQGYAAVSISFASLSIIVGYLFAFYALRDLNKLSSSHSSRNWLRAAIWFGILSTGGTIALSYMMATKDLDQTMYLNSIFFYLHFQYNGWFIFACIGLLLDRMKSFSLNPQHLRYAFWFFFLSGIPTYFLSTLWAKLPGWLYAIVVVASVLQVLGWIFLVRILNKNVAGLKSIFPKITRLILLVAALAFTLKLSLQLGSTIPSVSELAFGFRPIVIAYLHLVLLLIISVFLLAFLYGINLLNQSRVAKIALIGFVTGAILNEIALATQGIAAIGYNVVPYINLILFLIALILFLSSIFLFLGNLFRKTDINQPLN
jgi:hypothetical protein